MKKDEDNNNRRRVIWEVMTFVIGSVLMALLSIQNNQLMARQNEISEAEYSPLFQVKQARCRLQENGVEYDIPEILVYNLHFPVEEYRGEAQCVLAFYQDDQIKRYYLYEPFRTCQYTSGSDDQMIMRLNEREQHVDLFNYMERCEAEQKANRVEMECYLKITYRDIWREYHGRFYDLSNGTRELEEDAGRRIFKQNSQLDFLEYDTEQGSFPDPVY